MIEKEKEYVIMLGKENVPAHNSDNF